MLKQKYFLTDFFILSAEKQPIKSSWRKIEWLPSIQSLNDIIKKYHFDTIESEWYIEDLISDFKGVLLSANKLREMV